MCIRDSFTLVRVAPKNLGGMGQNAVQAGKRWGFYPLITSSHVNDSTYFANMRLNIIQHPAGRPKEVALHSNHLDRLLGSHVRYTTDTEGGSSGSPVFDNRWVLVALHHAAGEKNPDGSWKNNQGVRIDRIISDIKSSPKISTEIKTELGF